MKRHGQTRGTSSPLSPGARPGFTVLEITLALAILMIAMGLVAQVGSRSVRERARGAARQEAVELAANVLEAARACSWEALTPEWAAGQSLPESAASRLHEGELTARVEPEKGSLYTKRVTVAVGWKQDGKTPARPVELVGLVSARAAAAKGSKP